MAEKININIEPFEIGIEYVPDTLEADIRMRMHAVEKGLHALARRAIEERRVQGHPVPEVFNQLVEAHTYQDHM